MPTPEGQRAWSDFESEAAALEDGALPDCSAALKALSSLAKATEHLCELAPERCQIARIRLQAARGRVHAACPALQLPPAEDLAPHRAASAPPPAPPRNKVEGPQPSMDAAPKPAAVAAPRKGGCASCTQASSSDLSGTLMLAWGVLAFIRRARRRASAQSALTHHEAKNDSNT